MSLCPFPAVSGLVGGCFLDGMFFQGMELCFYHTITEASHLSGTQPLLEVVRVPSRTSEGRSAVWAQRSFTAALPQLSCCVWLFPFHPLFFILTSSPPRLFQADISS